MKITANHNYIVYILTNKSKTALYVGVTNNIKNRLLYHSTNKNINAFTSKYNVYYLVYFEHYSDVNLAISREKQIKKFRRAKKEQLINDFNPKWNFLNDAIS